MLSSENDSKLMFPPLEKINEAASGTMYVAYPYSLSLSAKVVIAVVLPAQGPPVNTIL